MRIAGVLFILLALGAGIIALQIFLSKKDSKWAGLILPIISFAISLMALLSVVLFYVFTGTTTLTENGEIVEQTITKITKITNIYNTILSMATNFLIYNIPTIILLTIYRECRRSRRRSKRNRQRDLEKMSVQDLE